MKDLMKKDRNDKGFTLIEVLTTLALTGILLAMGGIAARQFWMNRALSGGAETVITQMRTTQEKASSESFPLVYGVRFDPGTAKWWVVKYDPVNPGPGDDQCTTIETHNFDTGVTITAASFDPDPTITAFCKTKLSAPADNAIAFFYPKGNATPGSVTLRQPTIDKTRTIEVAGITGRVSEQ
jgi:prepilin-type N-terminal cleavage/methylation domain-containing protein